MQVRNANWRKAVEEIFAGQPFMAFLGVRLVDATPGRVVLALPYRPELGQQSGFFHGGTVATLIDNSGGIAAGTLMAADQDVLAAEFKVNLLRPAVGERLTAEAQVVRAGRTLAVVRMDVYAEQPDGGRVLCAIGQGSYAYVGVGAKNN
jgi:uncharacterized protein (TIGR00369 family)